MLIGILANWLALVWWFSPPVEEQYLLHLPPGNPCPPGYSMVIPANTN
jgi:hypothetical protein